MMQVMCRLGVVAFTTLAILTSQATSVVAETSSAPERFEVSVV